MDTETGKSPAEVQNTLVENPFRFEYLASSQVSRQEVDVQFNMRRADLNKILSR